MKRSFISAALGATALCALPAGTSAKVMEVVTFAVPPAGTSGYILANAYSKTLREKTPIKKIVLQTFGGAAGWPARMQTGDYLFTEAGEEHGVEALSDAVIFVSSQGPTPLVEDD